MLWLLVSLLGLIITILTIRHYNKESTDIQNGKKRGIFLFFYILLAVASESSIFYLGLLLILFGIVKATGLL